MVYYIKPICSTHTKLYDPYEYNAVYDAPLEFRTRMLIQCDKLLYIVKGKWAPGYACVCLLPIR